jgi:hypothetical protein
MTEPTTETGRRLLDDILDPAFDPLMLAGVARARIRAIEAEARADLAAAARAVIDAWRGDQNWTMEREADAIEHLAAVLAAIEEAERSDQPVLRAATIPSGESHYP